MFKQCFISLMLQLPPFLHTVRLNKYNPNKREYEGVSWSEWLPYWGLYYIRNEKRI